MVLGMNIWEGHAHELAGHVFPSFIQVKKEN